jgi:hypothetical protein
MPASRYLIALLGTLCLAGVTLPAAAEDAPKPAVAPKPPAPPVKPKGPGVAPAVAALQKEYQAYLKDPKANRIRVKSDYFTEHPTPEATPEVIVKALETSVSGGTGTEAYVKWQLLSAIPGKFPDELLKRAINVYHRAPMPSEHPGMDHKGLKKIIHGIKKDEIPQIQKQFDEAVAQFRDSNEVFLSYRDELYSRLPVKLDAIYAGLEDVEERAGHGLNANAIFDNVAAAIRSWSITEAKADQVSAVANIVLNIKNALAREENKPYTKIVEEKGIKWKATEYSGVAPKKIDGLITFLENNAAGSNAGGLKFKDPPKKTN